MALQFEIDSLEGVDESVKSLYTEVNGKYRLGVDGLPQPEDTTGLKRKLQELLDEKKTEAQKRKEAEAEAERVRLEAATKSGDVEAVRKSYEEKISAEKQTYEQQMQSLNGMINGLTVGSTATQIASELALPGSAGVLLPHIKSRLTVEIVEGNPTVRVLDQNGKPSALTVEDLKREFLNNAGFAPIISGTRASGAGHRGTGDTSGGATKKFSEYTSEELKGIRKENPDLYNKLAQAHKQSKL